jgi:hypothetical protein
MDTAERIQLESALKDMTLTVLNELVAHNIKGAELIKKGVESFARLESEFEDHYETIKQLINMLKPVFEIARDWLVKCYSHLVAVFDWAKEMWNKIFGKK